MATLPYSIFPLIFLLIIGHTRSNAQSSNCDTASCESPAVPIRFPFWLSKANQSNRCGYPGFELKCNKKNQPLLTLPESGDFLVKTIFPQNQLAWINDPDECLPRRIMLNRGFSLAGSPFRLGNAFTLQNYSFFNCPYDTTSSYMVESIDCMSSTRNNYSVLAMLSNPPYPTRSNSSCHLISSALVPIPRFEGDLYWTSHHLDIQLQWDKPDCLDCEQRGGRCGFVEDSTDQVACYDLPGQGQGLSRKARYGLAIGLGIPGLLGIIGLVCLFQRRMRRIHDQRQQSRTEFSTLSIPHPPAIVMGLDGASIERYPKTQLGESGRLPNPNDTICSICLCEYQPKEMLRTIPECNHYFHADCIDGWLKMNGTCPLCRNLPGRSSSSSSSLPFSPTSSQ